MMVNGIGLNVVIAGQGPAVMLVHGFPDCHDVWRHQIPALIAAGYQVIAPDTRGCGDSDAPPGSHNYTIDLLVGDLLAILDQLGIARVRLAAHDWGAVIAWHLCIRHPERVDRYMTLSVGHPAAYANAPLEQKLKGWYVIFIQLRGIAEWIARLGSWRPFRWLAGYDEEAPRWIERLSRPGRLTAALNYYRANFGMLFTRSWPPVRVPVMGVYGTADRYLSESQMVASRRYVEASWRYERVEGANHWVQLTAPERVNALMLEFMR
jgi:pimeloyl-ACP methyl ester carboxylesterase